MKVTEPPYVEGLELLASAVDVSRAGAATKFAVNVRFPEIALKQSGLLVEEKVACAVHSSKSWPPELAGTSSVNEPVFCAKTFTPPDVGLAVAVPVAN
ncbi:MAG TPA: hypothetical protein VFO88_01125, partial [Gaiellaceae bacterium]|nr:hypothetical protein [Gaiellaceae bacterium]